MIFIFGDLHGEMEKIHKLLNVSSLTPDDYIIILGDFGGIWYSSESKFHVRDLQKLWVLEKLPCKTLFVDGNHENFDELYKYPKKRWHGGEVHEICKGKVYHLCRGYIFRIDGLTFFTFGGALSINRNYRIKGETWWEQEIPTDTEYRRGMTKLKQAGWYVDFILTHEAPEKCYEIVCPHGNSDSVAHYLQRVADKVAFKHWYFGHHHQDVRIGKRFTCVYNSVHAIVGNN